jgi:hypothetical protein
VFEVLCILPPKNQPTHSFNTVVFLRIASFEQTMFLRILCSKRCIIGLDNVPSSKKKTGSQRTILPSISQTKSEPFQIWPNDVVIHQPEMNSATWGYLPIINGIHGAP